jgi:tRNA dimethylallyltransferase
MSLEEATAAAIARTQRFAVRQDRWFRRDPRIHWVDIETDPVVAVPHVMEAFTAWV